MIEKVLAENVDLQNDLYIRGFLVTTKPDISGEGFPFYGNWNHTTCNEVHFWTHNLTGLSVYSEQERFFFLLGHAYNPFTMEINEKKILRRLAENYDKETFIDSVDELTGVFVLGVIDGERIIYLTDPSGIQSACCGVEHGDFYLSSHSQMVADLCGLKMDAFVRELIEYKWYPRVMGAYLPADLTPFKELKRVVPNQAYTCDLKRGTINHKRFYPLRELKECVDEQDYNQTIEEAADILKNNMELIVRKWKRPQISLTGGIDSNTTFAAANGNYDKISTFSYLSAEKESIDCDAAQKIAAHFQVPWICYRVPECNDEVERFAEKAAILRHNNGYVAKEKDNELRKRMVLREQCTADVEVKSWISETIRGYWYKYLGRKKMPKLSGKLYRNLYKIFITNRSLAHEVDKLFDQYIEEYEYRKVPGQYPPADMHYSEIGWGSWGSMNISEMKYCFDITFIYNNRRFLDLMFRVPLEKRISDQHHLDMKKYLNPDLYNMGIRVVNMHETKFRAFALNVIFTINSILPF